MALYLNKFSKDQKIASLGLAQRLVKEDSRLREKEISVLYTLRAEMNLEEDFIVPETPFEELVKPFMSKREKMQVLSELFFIGIIDGELDETEEKFLKMISKAFGLENEIFNRMKNNCLEFQKILKNHYALIDEVCEK